jgi:hypothetical protein
MTAAAIAEALLKFGPTILPYLIKVGEWIKAGKSDVTAADLAELTAYGQQKADDYLKAIGVTPPGTTALPTKTV